MAYLPRFKKKGRHDAFRYPDPKPFAVDDGHGRGEAAEAGLGALPQEPVGERHTKAAHDLAPGRPLVRFHPDGAGGRCALDRQHLRPGEQLPEVREEAGTASRAEARSQK